ncbi:Nitroreductase [Epilithonimonas bovis DSM 19482]|jgi:nitroreductase|uniref:Nitroreductase n=1 Tax=Epilithonimonas bovis DSM 19482 TaxID=1121284 RepID=A0A1U7PZ93_9FLAO|nr:nitroreductase [Epilithonimonas bovis]SIT97158.1 Nitroreductase [Epilithonimonas bovis DSM 19482]
MENATILKHIIEERRSIFPKDYTDKPIPELIINEVLSNAVLAPNHKRTKPWRFKVFKGEEKQKLAQELQNIYRETTPDFQFLKKKYDDIGFKINKANVVISIVVEYSQLVPDWEEIAATAMAVQNMYLTCTANKVGCYWSSPKIVNHLKDSLKIEENQQCLGLFYMGSLD